MTLRVPTAGRNAGLNAIFDRADAGTGPGTIEYRTGAQPATADTAASGTLLATFVLADPAFFVAAAGVKDLDADPDISATAVAAGTAGWARCYSNDGAGTVSNKALTTNVATLTTTTAHGLIVGSVVLVAGVDATFNGTYTVASVPTTTTFTYSRTAANVASAAATGTVAKQVATVFDGSIDAAGADFIINSTSITAGQTVNLTLGSITDPA